MGYSCQYLVEHPLRSGPQGCLIIEHNPDGTESWQDAFIFVPQKAIPKGPPPEPIECKVYKAAMGLINSAYSKDASRLLYKFSETLENETWTNYVFALTKLHGFIEQLHGLADRAETGELLLTNVADEIRTVLEDFEDKPRESWNPVELVSGTSALRFERNWEILSKWRQWDQKKLLLSERARQFEGLTEASDGDKKRREIRKIEDAFRKRLKYLGLPATGEELEGAEFLKRMEPKRRKWVARKKKEMGDSLP